MKINLLDNDKIALCALALIGVTGLIMGIDNGFHTLIVGSIAGIAGYHIRGQKK